MHQVVTGIGQLNGAGESKALGFSTAKGRIQRQAAGQDGTPAAATVREEVCCASQSGHEEMPA
jgi:hypothetical protein